MKLTICWLLVICSVLGSATATQLQPFGPKCLSNPWNACVPDNIKVRDAIPIYPNTTCICSICEHGVQKETMEVICASLSDYGLFPATQWVALRGIHVGNLSSQTLGVIRASSLTVLSLVNAGISTIESNIFARFPNLRSVHLDYNTLSQLKRAYFSGWNKRHNSTAFLSFSYNRIANLDAGCFEEISHLAMLDLSHNLLSEVASGWFRGLAFLHSLNLAHNKIEVISANALNFLYDLRVLNLSHNPLTCLSERTLSGLPLQTFSLGGECPVSWEQDIKMNWSLLIDKTFPHRKQEVRLRIDNLRFCLIYSVAQKHFQLKWVLLDKYSSKGQEPGCSSFAFSPLNIPPPFVVTTALGGEEKNFHSASNFCPEAWNRHDGITSALKGGVGLKLVGIDNWNNRSDGIALVSSYPGNPDFMIGSQRKSGVRNISCLVFFLDQVSILPARRFEFQGAEGGAYSKCPDLRFSQDNLYIKPGTGSTDTSSQTTDCAAGYLEKSTAGTRLNTIIMQDVYKTLTPLGETSVTLPVAKRTTSLYLISLIGLPGLILIIAMVYIIYKHKTISKAAPNVPDTTNRPHIVQSGICTTSLTTATQGQNQKLSNCPDGIDVEGTRARGRLSVVSIHSYEEVKDEDVYDPSTGHNYSEIKDEDVTDTVMHYTGNNNEPSNAAQNVPVVTAPVQFGHQIIDVTQLIGNPMYTKSNQPLPPPSESTDLPRQIPHRRSQSSLSTDTYCEIKDEDVYDPTSTHTYSEIKDEEAHGMPVNVVRVKNSKLNNTSQKNAPNVVTTPHGSRQFIDATDLISNPMYKKSLAQPIDCSGPNKQITHRQSTLSTHSYCEIDEEEVYDPSLTHTYSEIKDDEVDTLSAPNENREQGDQSLEGGDDVRKDEQEEDPDDDVVTFYAAVAEVALSPSTKKRDAQQQYGTGPENIGSCPLYSAAKEHCIELEKK